MTTDQIIHTLVQRRQALGHSQRALDEMVGVSESMVAKWESGYRNPTLRSAGRWAAALGLRLELVVPGAGKRKKSP
jgi:transcriptional regulator with XRE-family HTH domain